MVVSAGIFGPAATNFRREVQAYDPTIGSWENLAPLPVGRGNSALVTLPGNRIFVMGGDTGELADGEPSVGITAPNVWTRAIAVKSSNQCTSRATFTPCPDVDCLS